MTRKRPTSPTITPNGQKKAKLHRNSSPQTSSTSHTNDNALSGRLYVVLDGNKDDKHYMRRIRREKKEECQKQGRILLPRHIISSDGILTFFWRKKPPLAPLFQSIANAEVVARPDDCGLKVDDPIIIDIDQGSSSSKPASTANRATSVKTRDSSLAYVLMNENTHMSALTSTHLDPCHDRDSAAILERQASHEGSSRSLTPQRVSTRSPSRESSSLESMYAGLPATMDAISVNPFRSNNTSRRSCHGSQTSDLNSDRHSGISSEGRAIVGSSDLSDASGGDYHSDKDFADESDNDESSSDDLDPEAMNSCEDMSEDDESCIVYIGTKHRKTARGQSESSEWLEGSLSRSSSPIPWPSEHGPASLPARVRIPKTPHGKARRILVPGASDHQLPLISLTRRCDVQFFHPQHRYRITEYSLPNTANEHLKVVDAFIAGSTAVIGLGGQGPSQISLVPVPAVAARNRRSQAGEDGLPRRIDLPIRAFYNTPKKQGRQCISALAVVGADPLEFLSGSEGGLVHLWKPDPESYDARARKVDIGLGSRVRGLAYRRTGGHALVVCAGEGIWEMDIERSQPRKPAAKLSNSIHHIHIHPQDPNICILEVRDTHKQVRMFDLRQKGFNAPCIEFGDRVDKHRMFVRGATSQFASFVRGYDDGYVRVWDYRNVKDAVLKYRHRHGALAWHTAFHDSYVVAYGDDDVISWWDTKVAS